MKKYDEQKQKSFDASNFEGNKRINDEVDNNNWHVEVFEDTSIRFETIEDITKFIQVTEKNIS